jgi:hypothetical protein
MQIVDLIVRFDVSCCHGPTVILSAPAEVEPTAH